MKTVYEITYWSEEKFKKYAELQELDTFYAWFFSRSQKLGWKRGLRGFRAIALMSVLSRRYAAVLVGLLHDEKG